MQSISEWNECPNSVSGHDNGDRDGKCTWCGRKVNTPVAWPDAFPISELTDWYGMYYDPDYGSERQ